MPSQFELNRSLLRRQRLDQRVRLPIGTAVEQLAGLNGQYARGPYVGLWNRLTGFDPAELTALLVERRIVRATLMRGTVHLVSADDYRLFQPALVPMLERSFRGYFPDSRSLDIDALAERARKVLAERPLSRPELDRELAPLAPDARPGSRAFAARARLALVQVPPAGVWGAGREVRYTLAEDWLGTPMAEPAAGREHLVRRYLAAFGPATAADLAAWSGVAGWASDLERMGPTLQRFDDGGRTWFDLGDTEAVVSCSEPLPVRFLPDYDNVLFGHRDRTRVLSEVHRRIVVPAGRRMPGTVLVDGFVAATWRLDAAGPHPESAPTVRLEPLDRIEPRHRDALAAEADRLARFLLAHGDGPGLATAGDGN